MVAGLRGGKMCQSLKGLNARMLWKRMGGPVFVFAQWLSGNRTMRGV